jgi:hypothetical protein
VPGELKKIHVLAPRDFALIDRFIDSDLIGKANHFDLISMTD